MAEKSRAFLIDLVFRRDPLFSSPRLEPIRVALFGTVSESVHVVVRSPLRKQLHIAGGLGEEEKQSGLAERRSMWSKAEYGLPQDFDGSRRLSAEPQMNPQGAVQAGCSNTGVQCRR